MNAFRYAPAQARAQARGRDYSAEQRLGALSGAQTRRVPPPKNIKLDEVRPDLLSRALSWLRGDPPAPKRLRLAETVSLGEKRFVAIIHAEGHKFLVGGGASGVVLLTDLDEGTKPLDNLGSFAELVEAAG
ncbi:MAG: flagellar biosynthetic protein FliO [Terracidiphilus sp.]